MRKRLGLVFKFLLLAVGIGIFVLIRESLPIVSGYGAKVLCSGVFVAGRSPEAVIKNDLSGFPLNLGTYTVDRGDSSVTGKVWGFAERKAVYRYGLGATLVSGMTEGELKEQRIVRMTAPAVNPDTVDWPMGDRVVSPGEDSAALREAMGMAFGDGGIKETGTRAVIVVHHGRIVAERYASGFDRHTRLTGWSMTKSITNALIGILVRQGLLNVAEPAPVEQWLKDERSKITIENLLRMNSGLKWWEFYGGPSDATRMLYREKDMGEYAMKSKLGHKPGEVFYYSSGTANILSSIIRRTVGNSVYYRFPYQQLFYRIGMYSAVLEPDAGGTFVGSSYCYATARDWARLGLLYLQDGVWNGQRVLPEGWVDFTRRGEEYGALWWLNRNGRHPHIPRDCYGCEGYEGQYVWVIPSKDLVLVRMARENGRKLDPDVFVPAVTEAMK
jgi:CubicO group peptidase (beta-lactamase class C family)